LISDGWTEDEAAFAGTQANSAIDGEIVALLASSSSVRIGNDDSFGIGSIFINSGDSI
jgi:hypothetical protein